MMADYPQAEAQYVPVERDQLESDVADPGQLPRALDAQQHSIELLSVAIDQLGRTLAPITADVSEKAGPGAIAHDPSPPASQITRRVRQLTDEIDLLRDRVAAMRAYLDLG